MNKIYQLRKVFGLLFMIGIIIQTFFFFYEIYYSEKFCYFDILFFVPVFLFILYFLFFLFVAKKSIIMIIFSHFLLIENIQIQVKKRHPLEMIFLGFGVFNILEYLMLGVFFFSDIKNNEEVKLFYCFIIVFILLVPIIFLYFLFCIKNSIVFKISKHILPFLFMEEEHLIKK